MKKIVYLGYLVTPEEANKTFGASVAGNKMQWNVIKNLSLYDDLEIYCITISPLAAFPHERKLYQKRKRETLMNGVCSIKIGFCNLPLIKQIWQIFSVFFIAKKIVKELHADILFSFNMFPQIGIPMRWLKKIFPDIETVCLLADLPIDDNTNRKGLSIILRRIFEKSTWKSLQICDKYVVLNKFVIENYLPGKSYVVVEGGVDEDDLENYNKPVEKARERNVLFSGALTEYNGILNLIEAMEFLKDTDIILDIYGGGYLEKVVREAANRNPKIHYYGSVSNSKVMQKQREAWLLINPRIIDDPIAQVTFPSKTFEYLLSGTPVLSSRLNGYGKEYQKYMYWLDDLSPDAIAKKIRELTSLSDIDYGVIGQLAQKMIVDLKSWNQQCKKIYDLLQRKNDK